MTSDSAGHVEEIAKQSDYEQTFKVLSHDLVQHIEEEYSHLPLSPLFDDKETLLADFYVLPNLNAVESQKGFDKKVEHRYPIKSLQELLLVNDKHLKKIYLTADAGMGKTAFSKYLALVWSQAKKPDLSRAEYISEDAIEALKKFDILFLVQLREAGTECEIDKMIYYQVVCSLLHSESYDLKFIQRTLDRKRCLIVLDGLDEWSHPSSSRKNCQLIPKTLPHSKPWGHSTVLTTTRSWKLSSVNVKSSRIDRRVEIAGLSKTTTEELKGNAISRIKNLNDLQREDELPKYVAAFNDAIENCELQETAKIPMILLYLICLWCEGKEFGNSKTEIYGNIVELLLTRTALKYESSERNIMEAMIGDVHMIENEMPFCFRKLKYCRKFFLLMLSLGKLAFVTLFDACRERTLVFDRSAVDRHMSKDEIAVSLTTGILTESKVSVSLTRRQSNISFQHKSIQEWFAAVYMQSVSDHSCVVDPVLAICNSLQSVLEMSKAFIFLGGMNPILSCIICNKLRKVVAEDEVTLTYRWQADYKNKTFDRLKDFQNTCVSCVKEIDRNSGCTDIAYEFKLEDFIIDKDCQDSQYLSCLQRLAIGNNENIKSLCIKDQELPGLGEIIDMFELHAILDVEKLYYWGEYSEEEIHSILIGSVDTLKTVTFRSGIWEDDRFIPEPCFMSDSVLNSIQNMTQLTGIFLIEFVLTHRKLESLMNYIGHRATMKEIGLLNITCCDHGRECIGFDLDLSKHTDLRTLDIYDLPLSYLNINVGSLTCFLIGVVPNVFLSCISYLLNASKLHTVTFGRLESDQEIDILLEIMPLLIHVEDFSLVDIILGDRELIFSPDSVNIENIELWRVEMSCSVFRKMIHKVTQYQHSVTVRLNDCIIIPKDEYEIVKTAISDSDRYRVMFDGRDDYGNYEFKFKTVCHKEEED